MEQYFSDDELRCKCCGALVIDTVFRIRLNLSRYLAGFPFEITSGHRCEKHNIEVGSTSVNHVIGKAADIKCEDAHKRFVMVKAIQQAGILGIGIGKVFVHADINRAVSCIWTY